jgi:HlyD family secretion protein
MGRHKLRLAALTGAVLALGLVAFLLSRRETEAKLATITADRGDILETVGATGALQAVTTVQVGSQVSGTIASLGADFNSVVKKGQVIARLDPSLFEARLGQARASLVVAQANVERQRAVVADTEQKYGRARELHRQQLVPESDLETAKANHEAAIAQLRANEAAVSQSQANVNQAQVDLNHTVIATPIDGVVIARNVDVGQTVAASLQAPTLFVIANDLTRMQVNASVDEADIGRVKPGQEVTFRVDSYPEQNFVARVEQVRLQPQTVQNVVSYNTIISVDNGEQKLMPGMTATVSIIVNKAENVVRVPASALRFRPEGYEDPQRPRRPDGPPGGSGSVAAAGRPERGRRGPGDGQAGARPGLVFVLDETARPAPAPVKVGLSDGQFVEVKEGLAEGATVVTGTEGAQGRAGGPRGGTPPSNNPFQQGPPQRRQR